MMAIFLLAAPTTLSTHLKLFIHGGDGKPEQSISNGLVSPALTSSLPHLFFPPGALAGTSLREPPADTARDYPWLPFGDGNTSAIIDNDWFGQNYGHFPRLKARN